MHSRTGADIRRAVQMWLVDSETAERHYGHISAWDVSRLMDMSELFKQKMKGGHDEGWVDKNEGWTRATTATSASGTPAT